MNKILIVLLALMMTGTALARKFYLTTYFAEKVTQGYRSTENDLSIDGNPLRIGGKTYARGLGTHANGEMVYRFNGVVDKFTVWVGIDDETNKLGTVVFQVFGDDKELFNSGIMKGGEPPKFVDLSLTGVQALRLVCDGTEDRISFDHANWAEARISTENTDLIEKISETEKVNYLNLLDPAAITALKTSEQMVELKTAAGAPLLRYYPRAGVYDVLAGEQTIANARLVVNGEEILRGAEFAMENAALKVTNRLNGIKIDAEFGLLDEKWVTLQIKLKNEVEQPRKLYSLTYLLAELKGLLKDKTAGQLHFFTDSYSAWDQMPGHRPVEDQPLTGNYLGAVFSPGTPVAWTAGFMPPQMWPGCIRTNGSDNQFSIFIDLYGKPFVIDPNEVVVFDKMALSGQFNLTGGLLAYGRLYQPHTPPKNAARIHGFNTWEFYKGDIHQDNMTEALNALKNGINPGQQFTYFVLDNGWKTAYGDWSFIEKKWPAGGKAWADSVQTAGLVPGVWLAPFWVSPEIAKKENLRAYPQNEEGGLADLRVRIDPSDPGLKQRVFDQVRQLREMGFRYFKTDFLFDVYKGNRDYKFSKFAPERVMREFMLGLRQAMGEDSFWLACGTVTAPCAGLVDASRIGMDVKAGWDWLRNTIIRRNGMRFWMHGNLWLNDQDCLIVRGPEFWNKGYEEPRAVDVPAPGFTPDEARTWCAWLVISGGPIMWSDHPLGINDKGRDLVARTLRHGGGAGGIPLDLEQTNWPAKWIRRDGARIYLALFNWDENPTELSLSPSEVPELKECAQARDIFTDAAITIENGLFKCALRPHQSTCVLIKE